MILLDTCTLLWLVAAPSRLSKRARATIDASRGQMFVSAISAFEVAIKHRRRALVLPLPADEWYAAAIAHHGVVEIAVTGSIAARSVALPALHADPADRMIVATAQDRSLTVVTPDRLIGQYPDVSVIW